MMRLLYVLLTCLLSPVVIAMEGWKALWNPEYRGRLPQRLGFVEPQAQAGCLWVHAVSVGEVQAAAALIAALRREVAGTEIVITTVTPTGAQRARALFGVGVRHCYLPIAPARASRSSSRPRSGRPCMVRSAAAASRS